MVAPQRDKDVCLYTPQKNLKGRLTDSNGEIYNSWNIHSPWT